jgi:hypothetical protein
MYDDLALMLPVAEINKRLTRNARERDRLRAMLRIVLEARDDAEKYGSTTFLPQSEATAGPRKGVAQ